ncbi:MAG: hypothetical protein JXA99_15090 [Candidatus Lokiarchaeota archaeon]|nr:hypothetical protein [Candidatus Lokiarchaeota archaeon]
MANNILYTKFMDENFLLSPIQNNLIRLLKNDGPLTRKQIVNQLDTPRTTVFDNLTKLQKRRVVEKFSRNNGKRGRPKVYWRIKNN